MDERIEPLSATEYNIIEEALWKLVRQYPRQLGDPDVKVEYDALGKNTSLSVVVYGGRYKGRNVIGGFTAEVTFRVEYKSFPTSSDLRIKSQAFVGRIMRWLENTRDLPLLTDGRAITKITASGAVPYKDETGTDKSTVYAADAVMEYKKESNW